MYTASPVQITVFVHCMLCSFCSIFVCPERWKNLHAEYLAESSKLGVPVHLVFYENLKSNLAEELLRLADFLSLEIPAARLACLLQNQEGQFHRQPLTEKPEFPFTKVI